MNTCRDREMDLQVRGVEFLVAQSQVCLQSLSGLVEVDTLSALALHLDPQLVPLLAQFLQILLFIEQLGNAVKLGHSVSYTIEPYFTTIALKQEIKIYLK